MLQINETLTHEVTFCQEQLDAFSQITGDFNPIHTKKYYDDHPELGGVVVQGMLVASKFGMVFGTEFPGRGTINVERAFSFWRPVYTNRPYSMNVTLESVDVENHTATLFCSFKDADNKICVSGRTVVKNDSVIIEDNFFLHKREDNKVLQAISLPTPQQKRGLFDALRSRRSLRSFLFENISDQELSNLLWAACGVNKEKQSDEGIRYFYTNPTASNHQEVSVYVFTQSGVYLYEPINNELHQLLEGDFRKQLSEIPFVKKAMVSLCIVSDMSKMVHHTDTFRRQLYSAMDVGYVSENLYLYCAASRLATCACGLIDRVGIAKLLGLENARVMLVHPIGVKKNQ